jgi:hypothetical protein
VSPILGIWASQNYSRTPSTGYVSISTVTLGASQTTISFSSIPSTYKHLQIRGIGRTTNAVPADQAKLQINGDTSSGSYAFHQLYGNGSTVTSEGYPTGTVAGITPVIRFTGASATSGIFGATVIDILDYANTNKYKTMRTIMGYDANGSGVFQLVSGLWLNTSAITSLTLSLQAGSGDFAQYSSFALYGIQG